MKLFMLMALATFCLSQSGFTTKELLKKFEEDPNWYKSQEFVLGNYAKRHAVQFDTIKYSLKEKDKIIYDAYFSNNYERIESLVFRENDIKLKNLHMWVDALYKLQSYSLINLFFTKILPDNETVLISSYKLGNYEGFLLLTEHVKNPSRILKFYILKAQFYTHNFEKVSQIETPYIRNEMTKTMSLLKFRSLFYLKKFNEAIKLGRTFDSKVLEGSPKDYLRLAVSYLSTNQLDVAELLFKNYEKFYRATQILGLQKALFYQGFIHDEQDDFVNAEILYKQVLELSDISQPARGVHKNYAIHFEETNNYSNAIKHWETYSKLLAGTETSRKNETEKRIVQLREKLFLHPVKYQ